MSNTTLSTGAVRELERDIRRQILAIENEKVEDALFSMLALVIDLRQQHDLAVAHYNAPEARS